MPAEIRPAFHELKVLKHLRNTGITKRFGFTCSYLFHLVFVLIFHHRNWFQLLDSAKSELLLGKDAMHRFLNHIGFAWRRFLLFHSIEPLRRNGPAVVVSQLVELINDVSKRTRKRFSKLIRSQLQKWINGLLSYIKAYPPALSYEG